MERARGGGSGHGPLGDAQRSVRMGQTFLWRWSVGSRGMSVGWTPAVTMEHDVLKAWQGLGALSLDHQSDFPPRGWQHKTDP